MYIYIYIHTYITPLLYIDVHLPTPLHEPQKRDVWPLGVYGTVGTTAVFEDLSGNGSISGFRPARPDPPQKKYLPARLGPGSHGLGPGSRAAVSEMAPNLLLDHHLEATTGSKWLDMLPRWFWHLFGGQLDPTWGHFGPLLEIPEARQCNTY